MSQSGPMGNRISASSRNGKNIIQFADQCRSRIEWVRFKDDPNPIRTLIIVAVSVTGMW